MSSIAGPYSSSIIHFSDIQRISGAISDAKQALEGLERELRRYRPQAGRTVMDLSSGSTGYLSLPKPSPAANIIALANIKGSIDKLAEQLSVEAKGYESDFASQLAPVLELIEQLTNECCRLASAC